MATNVTWDGITYSVPAGGEINWPSLSNFLIALGNKAATSITSKNAIRVALVTPDVVSATADYSVVTKLTAPAAVAVNLPAGVAGQTFVIMDGTGDARTNNVTITPFAGGTIGGAATLVLDHDGQAAVIQYVGTDWKVLVKTLPSGTVQTADLRAGSVTGTGNIVLATSPALVTPTGIVKGDVGLGNVDNTSDATKNAATATLTNKTLTGNIAVNLVSGAATVTLPTTTGTLATLANAETLTNKTLTSNIAVNLVSGAAIVTLPTTTGTLATLGNAETLTNKTLTSPTLTTPILTTPILSSFEDFTDIAVPATPSAGILRVYSASGSLYTKDSLGTVTQLLGQTGLLPLGGVVATFPNLTGAYVCATTTAADAVGFVKCNGGTIVDATSPMNGVVVPNINNSIFLMGSTTAGSSGGNNNTTLTTTQLPVHGHGAGTYATSIGISSTAASGTFASSGHNHNFAHSHAAAYFSNSAGGGAGYFKDSIGNSTTTIDTGNTVMFQQNNSFAGGGQGGVQTAGTSAGTKYTSGVSSSDGGGSGSGAVTGGPSATASVSGGTASLTGSNAVTGTSANAGTGSAYDSRPAYISAVYCMRIK